MIIYWINQANIKGKKKKKNTLSIIYLKKTHYQLFMFIKLGAWSL